MPNPDPVPKMTGHARRLNRNRESTEPRMDGGRVEIALEQLSQKTSDFVLKTVMFLK